MGVFSVNFLFARCSVSCVASVVTTKRMIKLQRRRSRPGQSQATSQKTKTRTQLATTLQEVQPRSPPLRRKRLSQLLRRRSRLALRKRPPQQEGREGQCQAIWSCDCDEVELLVIRSSAPMDFFECWSI